MTAFLGIMVHTFFYLLLGRCLIRLNSWFWLGYYCPRASTLVLLAVSCAIVTSKSES